MTPLRKTFTYDQGREVSCHRQIAQHTGVQVYFCEKRSSWQLGTNENSNRLLRQYLPKGAELSKLTQEDIDTIAVKMNNESRKVFGFHRPLEVYAEIMNNIKITKLASMQ